MSIVVSTPVPPRFFRLSDAAEVTKRGVDPVNPTPKSFGNLAFAARAGAARAGVVKKRNAAAGSGTSIDSP
jgi:hypothetical protein